MRYDLLKVINRPWPDMTMTPWYLIYTNINSALVIVVFVSILDDSTCVLATNFSKHSNTILRLWSESLLARSSFNGGVRRTRRDSNNAVFSLRRELKGVFGISLMLERIGRSRSKWYKLSIPENFIDLATRSWFLQNATLPHVTRKSPPIILTNSSSIQDACIHISSKPYIYGKCVVNNIIYNIVNYGAQGNCLFLAVAGSLRSFIPSSVQNHKSVRYGVSE